MPTLNFLLFPEVIPPLQPHPSFQAGRLPTGHSLLREMHASQRVLLVPSRPLGAWRPHLPAPPNCVLALPPRPRAAPQQPKTAQEASPPS